jgi:hypothetical protein
MQILSLQLNADAVPFGTAPVVLHAPGMEARYLRLTFLTMAKMAGRWTFALSEMIFDLMGDLAASEEDPAETQLLAHYLKPDLFIIDDMGLKTLPARSGNLRAQKLRAKAANPQNQSPKTRPPRTSRLPRPHHLPALVALPAPPPTKRPSLCPLPGDALRRRSRYLLHLHLPRSGQRPSPPQKDHRQTHQDRTQTHRLDERQYRARLHRLRLARSPSPTHAHQQCH